MSNFRKYMHVERFGNDEVLNITTQHLCTARIKSTLTEIF